VNRGELPQYHVQNSHTPIVSRELFEQVQQERAKRAKKYSAGKSRLVTYPFSNRILCGKCGHHFRRKHTAAGTKYEKVVWICSTFNTFGKAVCDAQQIPESILCEKAASILGLSVFNESIFSEKISEICIPAHNTLVFVFRDGTCREMAWQNPSRRESWTAEMKQAARERSAQRHLKKERTEQK